VALPIQIKYLSMPEMPVLSAVLHSLRTDRLQRRKATNIFIQFWQIDGTDMTCNIV